MSSNIRLQSGNESTSSVDSHQSSPASSIADDKKIVIDGRHGIYSLVFLVDGEHVVSGGQEKKIRCWQVEDGTEAGMPMDVGSPISDMAVSRDGKWIVVGTDEGQVQVWDAETREKATEFKAHSNTIRAIDISPDTRIATGSDDGAFSVWSFSGGRLLGPWEDGQVNSAKFSPDGSLLAIATWWRESVRVFGSRDGHSLVDVPIPVDSTSNNTLAWASDGKQLYFLSWDGYIHCLDVFTGVTLSICPIHSRENTRGISLARNGVFIAASANSSVSFWSTATQEQIGPVIEHSQDVWPISISDNYDLVTGGGKTVTLRSLYDILPPSYIPDIKAKRKKTVQDRIQSPKSQPGRRETDNLVQTLRTHEENLSGSIVQLGKTNEELQHELAQSLRTADEQKGSIESLQSDLTRDTGSRKSLQRVRGWFGTSGQEKDSLNKTIVRLETTNKELCTELTTSFRIANEQKDTIKALQSDLRTQETSSRDLVQQLRDRLTTSNQEKDTLSKTIKRLETANKELCDDVVALNQEKGNLNKTIVELEKTSKGLRDEFTSFNQEKHSLNKTLDSFRARDESASNNIARLEQTIEEHRTQLADAQRKADSLIQIKLAHEKKHQCEFLYDQGRICDAAGAVFELTNPLNEDVKADKLLFDWLTEFTQRCIKTLERIGDDASNAEKWDEVITAYSAALSLCPSSQDDLLMKWASTILIGRSAREALSTVSKSKVPKFVGYRAICETLERDDRLMEAIECFQQMQNKLSKDESTPSEPAQWELDFRGRCAEKLEKLGDTERDSKKHDEAIRYYSGALSLDPTNRNDILLKHSNEVIELDPSSYKGYEGRHEALHGMGRHSEAFKAFSIMLSKIHQSPDPSIRELHHQYIDVTALIGKAVERTIRHMPRILIDTATGCLYNKMRQATAFEELPIFDELRSSMTTKARLDNARIREEVKKFYRYVMFSHRWENGEPLFQDVHTITVYDLGSTPPYIKLQTLCRLVQHLGFRWVWSDTCCIDKKDNVVLQESLVAMFTWYRGSSLTIVYLRGIWSHSHQQGDLQKSIWNTRAWTYQEYVAAEIVQFYTEDWKPYLGLEMFNHKESPVIILEMQQAVGVFTEELAVLRPGLDRVREKLCLASTRQTTLVEDIAYSLLGIFNAAIPVIYGEGNRAVGRFLEHILGGSGDVTILAWTGRAGSYNSCLPPDLTVYNQLVPPHVPQPIEKVEMDSLVVALRSSLPDLSLAVTLREHLNKFPSPSFTASRLSLPGIVFSITQLDTLESGSATDARVYRATTSALVEVEITTVDDLLGTKDLLLVHPWIIPLLDQEFVRASDADEISLALRLVARLRQPFGALLLAPVARARYKRVAADRLITVRVREETPLTELIESIRTVNVQ